MSNMKVTITGELKGNRRKYDLFQGPSFNPLWSLRKTTINLNKIASPLERN
jgi:hypothetical protein